MVLGLKFRMSFVNNRHLWIEVSVSRPLCPGGHFLHEWGKPIPAPLDSGFRRNDGS